MNFMQKRAARESIEDGATDAGISNISTGEDNLDVQLAEVAPLDQQMDQLAGDGEVLAADTERTEAAIDTAEEALSAGEELPEEELAPAIVAGESIRRRWKLETPQVARESFRRGRGLTRSACEGWKENLKKLWQAFIEMVKTVIRKAKELKLKYFNVGKSAVKRAKAYEEKLKKLGSKKQKDEISGSFVDKLSVEGKFDPDQSASIAKDATSGKAKGAISKLAAQADRAALFVVSASDGGDASFSDPAGAGVELFGTAGTKLRVLPQFDDASGIDKMQTIMALPGNAYIQTASKTLAIKDGEATLQVVAFTTTGDANDEKNVPTPDAGKLRAATSSLKAIGENFEKVLKDFDAYDRELEKLEKAADKASKAFDKATEDGDRTLLSNARTVADQAVRNYQALNRGVQHVGRTVIAGLSGYIGAGIGAYGNSK
ncbi:internal head protein [Erwinia phage vB_EamM_EarlPhillipIV]|nr:internal head protein [Erwinia phage vB_EamM_EarlPhillipIV]ANZ48905.1 hypothetical protein EARLPHILLIPIV_55 [Erwinia phage vB_EamM_EarlPhillipIV]